MQPEEALIEQRKKKLVELRKLDVEPYPYGFEKKNNTAEILEKFKNLKKEGKINKDFSLAGRIVLLREMGKASFGHIQDETGRIQFYIREDVVGEKDYEIFKKLDLGDIIGINGFVFRTKKGEISIWVKKINLLAKAIRPLPEKWHGLKDVEQRYRQRYLDLIANPEVKKIFFIRSKIIDAMRVFLRERGFLEVDTPILQSIYGGANARPFKTFLHDLKMDVYMRISDELYLKKLVIGGFEKVFEIGRDFRNESIDRSHNPEFTMMECYWAYADYNDVMKLTEDMFNFIAKEVLGKTKIEYQGKIVDLKKPWERITMHEAIKKFAKLDIKKMSDDEIQNILRSYNIEYEGGFNRGIATELIFEELVENKLIQPIFITDYPKESTYLCKLKRGNSELIERFEPFIIGMEFGNAYSELNDPILQRKFMEMQARLTKERLQEEQPIDEEFIRAMEFGMPPMGGLGIGVDRLVMLFTNQASIRDVIFFPFMK